MARIRSIKHGFFTNEELADCSRDARLLFIGLWVIADREGRLKDKPRKIRVEVFPYDDIDVSPLLGELQAAKFIQRYQVNEESFIQIFNFTKHQRPHPKEAASEIPAPVGYIASPEETGQDLPNEVPEENLKPASREIKLQAVKLNGKQLKGNDEPVGGGVWIMDNGGGDGSNPPPNTLSAFADTCKLNLPTLNEKKREKLYASITQVFNLARQPDEVLAPRVRRFGEYFKTRGFADPTPFPSQVADEWRKFEDWEKRNTPKEIPPADPDIRAVMAKRRANEKSKAEASH